MLPIKPILAELQPPYAFAQQLLVDPGPAVGETWVLQFRRCRSDAGPMIMIGRGRLVLSKFKLLLALQRAQLFLMSEALIMTWSRAIVMCSQTASDFLWASFIITPGPR